jgi:hypothetical protein
MNHLIIFSLLAGLLGTVIGWLIRGSCKKLIQENEDKWREKLHKNETKHEYKIKKVKSNYAKHISKLNQKLLFMHDVLDKKEKLQEKTEGEIEKSYRKELKQKENLWKRKRERLITNNDNNVIYLNRELSLMRKKLQILQSEEKRVLSTNIEYAYQIKMLTKKHFEYINHSKKEYLKLQNRFVIAENTIKKLKNKLEK